MRRKPFRRKNPNPVIKKKPFGIDWLLASLIILLSIFGVIMVFDASVVEAYQQFGDQFYFAKLQAIWVGVGLAALVVATLTPHVLWEKLAPIMFAASIILLFAVLIPGIGTEVHGARRWINLGAFSLQPSELAKLAAVVYLSSWLAKHQRLAPFLFVSGLLLSLIVFQPDLGTTIIISLIAITLYFLSGAPLRYLFLTGTAGVVLAVGLIIVAPYRLDRVKTFLDPTSDPLGTSYHIRQVLIALGSGGISGQGIGRSRQKYQYLPEATTDSIFAVIAEETGFVGASLMIIAFVVLINRGFTIAIHAPTQFSRLLAAGITSWFAYQAVINLAAMVALLPLTGVPLPFISYGGSSLITIMLASGILLNISRYRTKQVR